MSAVHRNYFFAFAGRRQRGQAPFAEGGSAIHNI
jgi:hypothetical protein